MICASNNTGIQRLQAAHPHPDKSFYHLHMDFDIELRPCECKETCLVFAEMFSK